MQPHVCRQLLLPWSHTQVFLLLPGCAGGMASPCGSRPLGMHPSLRPEIHVHICGKHSSTMLVMSTFQQQDSCQVDLAESFHTAALCASRDTSSSLRVAPSHNCIKSLINEAGARGHDWRMRQCSTM
jgi:hypothetical protein